MKTISYGVCQVVFLMNVSRAQGDVYFPEIAANLVTRYHFAKPPNLDDLSKDNSSVKFQIGKFKDVQINEFAIYNDGIIVNGKCPTETLEEFMADVMAFSKKEYGYELILPHRNELHFETNINVHADADIGAFVASPALKLIGKKIEEKTKVAPRSTGILIDFDPETISSIRMRRKPTRFSIERKLGIPFKENIFVCSAPLKTVDLLELLAELEREA